jgi:hypothetical protein
MRTSGKAAKADELQRRLVYGQSGEFRTEVLYVCYGVADFGCGILKK